MLYFRVSRSVWLQCCKEFATGQIHSKTRDLPKILYWFMNCLALLDGFKGSFQLYDSIFMKDLHSLNRNKFTLIWTSIFLFFWQISTSLTHTDSVKGAGCWRWGHGQSQSLWAYKNNQGMACIWPWIFKGEEGRPEANV